VVALLAEYNLCDIWMVCGGGGVGKRGEEKDFISKKLREKMVSSRGHMAVNE